MCTNQDGQIWELQSLLHSQVIPTLTWYACTTHSPLSLIRTGAKRLDLNFLCTHKKLISAISICFSKTWQQSTIPAIRLSWLPDLKLRKEKVSMYREKKILLISSPKKQRLEQILDKICNEKIPTNPNKKISSGETNLPSLPNPRLFGPGYVQGFQL